MHFLVIERHRLFSLRQEQWLDAGYGACPLRRREARESLLKILFQDNASGYLLWSVAIMPNHCHILASLSSGARLARIMQLWKGRSAREIRQLLKEPSHKPLWQKDYFDRLIRDAGHFRKVARHLRRNPEKAQLPKGDFSLWEDPEVAEMLA